MADVGLEGRGVMDEKLRQKEEVLKGLAVSIHAMEQYQMRTTGKDINLADPEEVARIEGEILEKIRESGDWEVVGYVQEVRKGRRRVGVDRQEQVMFWHPNKAEWKMKFAVRKSRVMTVMDKGIKRMAMRVGR